LLVEEVILTIIALYSSIIISIGALAWGFAEQGYVVFARCILIFGAIWFLAQRRNLDWFSALGLLLTILFAAFGIWFWFTACWMISAVIFALFAWDMSEFRRSLRFIVVDDHIRGLERRHIARVSLLIIGALFVMTLALLWYSQFTLQWGAFLTFLILLGSGQLAAWRRR
jgi:hypothetical protein